MCAVSLHSAHAGYIVLCDKIENMDFARFLLAFTLIFMCIALLCRGTLADKDEGTENQAVSFKIAIVLTQFCDICVQCSTSLFVNLTGFLVLKVSLK